MRRLKHWTPRYIVDRFSLYVHQWRYPEAPWLTSKMIDIFDSWLRPTDTGLEWGSGRSTTWLAQRIQHLTSVEHDPSWHARVREQIDAKSLKNVTYHLYQDELEYISLVESIPLASLDVCLVDGIARERCAIAVLPRLKAGGILVLDNSNWYLPCESRAPASRRLRGGADFRFLG